MSVCESVNVDIESHAMIAAGKTVAILETDLSRCNPQANYTAVDAFAIIIELSYVWKKGDVQNLPLNDEVDFLREFRNGQGLRYEDKAMVENPKLHIASGVNS